MQGTGGWDSSLQNPALRSISRAYQANSLPKRLRPRHLRRRVLVRTLAK